MRVNKCLCSNEKAEQVVAHSILPVFRLNPASLNRTMLHPSWKRLRCARCSPQRRTDAYSRQSCLSPTFGSIRVNQGSAAFPGGLIFGQQSTACALNGVDSGGP